jgi:hypothetical protein
MDRVITLLTLVKTACCEIRDSGGGAVDGPSPLRFDEVPTLQNEGSLLVPFSWLSKESDFGLH